VVSEALAILERCETGRRTLALIDELDVPIAVKKMDSPASFTPAFGGRGKISVRSGLSAENVALALVHETAHALSHARGELPDPKRLEAKEYVRSMLQEEVKAWHEEAHAFAELYLDLLDPVGIAERYRYLGIALRELDRDRKDSESPDPAAAWPKAESSVKAALRRYLEKDPTYIEYYSALWCRARGQVRPAFRDLWLD
jgi:hypothetical protein